MQLIKCYEKFEIVKMMKSKLALLWNKIVQLTTEQRVFIVINHTRTSKSYL